jgi:hypothetical protein
MDEDTASRNDDRSPRLERQLDRYLAMYQHHYELTVKGMFFYLAAIGAIGSYIFRADALVLHQRYFMLAMIYLSCAGIVTCIIALRWWAAMRSAIDCLCRSLNLDYMPLTAPKYILGLVIIDSLVLIGVAAIFLIRTS